MRWSMDTHKFMSEITRKALQIMDAHHVTSESEPEDIEATERDLAQAGVYKDFEGARGRIRRALFTYFKAYGCLDDNEHLTEIGKLFTENKLSVQEICFHFVLNYIYSTDEGVDYYPVRLILEFLNKVGMRGDGEAYISAYDFSKLVECDSYDDISEAFIDDIIDARREEPSEVNERTIGFDVWSNMLIKAGIFNKTSERNLVASNESLVNWIISAYDKPQHNRKGYVISGPIEYFPVPQLSNPGGNVLLFNNDGRALQAYLFAGGISKKIIERYIYENKEKNLDEMLSVLGLENAAGFYKNFDGLDRLVGYSLVGNVNANIRTIGEILTSIELTESEMDTEEQQETIGKINYKTRIKSKFSRNRIIFGAPGTGKSFTLNSEKDRLMASGGDYERVTFHPDYSYANFVGTYKPVMVDVFSLIGLDADTKEVIAVLNDNSLTAQEKYDLLYEKFKDDGLTRLPVLLGLYTDESFKTRKQNGSDAANDNSVEKNHGRAIRKYVNLITGKEKSSDIAYEYVPGPFMRMYVKALKSARTAKPKPYLLIIEEINRANVAAVFGDVFQLLDRDDDEVSEYPIQASEDIKKYLAKELGGNPEDYNMIKIPDNMFIWATMNSADQGVFPMDTAFKRRWDFTYLGIDDSDEDIRGKYVVVGSKEQQRIEWNELRKAINNFLANEKINEDKQLGPYFIARKIVVPADGGTEIDSKKFCDVFKHKVLMYLFDDAAKQKRGKQFEGSAKGQTRYSKICEGFDEQGIGIFHADIQSQTKIKDLKTNEHELDENGMVKAEEE